MTRASQRKLADAWAVLRALPLPVALFYLRAARLAYRSEDEHAIAAHMQPDSMARLLRLAKGRRRVVEVGTAEAWTAVALAMADRRRRVISLDPFPYPTRAGYLRIAPRSARARIQLVQEFGEVEPALRRVDFLFIDASHQRELTTRTFRAWQPALAPGAVVAFHDYDNPAFPGVNAAIADLGLDGEAHGDIFAWRAP